MSLRLPLLLIPLLVMALPGTAAPAYTSSGDYLRVAGPYIQLRQSKASSAAEAAAIAKRRYGGKILKVEAIQTDDGLHYRVKILLDNGRVKTVII